MNNESDSESSGSANNTALKVGGITLGALIVVYLGATWMVGKTSQARVDELVKSATTQLNGQLKLVERKSNPGFFSTTEDLTFSLDNPLYAAMLSKALPQFTIRNVISHGPLPGLRTIGVSRIETTLVLTDEQRKSLIETIGTDKPVEFVTTLGWSGSADMDIDSPKMAFDTPNKDGKVEWQGMNVDLHYSAGKKSFTGSGKAPGFSVTSPTDKVVMSKFAMSVDLQQRLETLYVGNESFTIDSIVATKTGEPETKIAGLRYIIDISEKNDYYTVAAQVGADTLDVVAQNAPQKFKDMHFDFGVEHLHGPTLASLTKTYQAYVVAMQESLGKSLKDTSQTEAPASSASEDETPPAPTTSPAAAEQLAKLKADGIALLVKSPIFKLNHLGFSTDKGDLKLIGSAQLNNVTIDDLEPTANPEYLINKLLATGEFSIAQSLVDSWSLGMTPDQAKQTFDQMIKEGFIKRAGDRLVTHLEYKEGKITANEKPVGPQ